MISKLLQLLKDMTPVFNYPGIVFYIVEFLQQINWFNMVKVTSFYVIALLEVGLILFINDYVYDYFGRRRVKTHKMTISNNGNTSSIFLLRTVELPESLAIRFRAGGNPLIWISRREKDAESEKKEAKMSEKNEQTRPPLMNSGGLIPDLKNPMNPENAIGVTRQAAGKAQKKMGLFASIFGGISSLNPKPDQNLQQLQSSFRDAQQAIGQAADTVNTKFNGVELLKEQVGSLVPDQAKQAGGFINDKMPLNGTWSTAQRGTESRNIQQRNVSITDSSWERNFVYDERVWQKNIGKVDKSGGSLIYAQSKILPPGESMQINIEIMNLSGSSAAVSHLYKIEVVQIPQTNLQLAAPNQYVNGIVIFPKISQLNRLLPPVIMIGLMILSIQLLSLFSYFIF